MKNDGLTRDEEGKRTDKTASRDLTFNNWHRKFLSNKCYATDIDFFEYRYAYGKPDPVAFLEVKQSHVKSKKYLCSYNSKAIFLLSEKVEIPFFIILYDLINEDTSECEFYVWQVMQYEDFEKYSVENFLEFFKKYDNKTFIEFMEEL